ncbi:MAG: hypothetical protein PHC97_03870 [Patescibacteria group bacterium]|nr:hypothetical protein [Patescibacteria group bacterium]
MTKKFLKDSLLWGFVLWFIGYVLGFVFFALVPATVIGWYVMPFGIIITLFVAFKFIKSTSWPYCLKVGVIWTILAMILDYIFIVQLLNSTSYYKLDVYVYYGLTLVLPVVVGWYKRIGATNDRS